MLNARSIQYFALILYFVFCANSFAVDSWRYVVYPQNGELIDPKKDHFSVSLIQMYVSSKDSLFRRIFESNKNAAVTVGSTASFFDNKDPIATQRLATLQSLGSQVGRPVGLVIQLQNNIPADAA